MELITELVKTAILTGRIANRDSQIVSLLLISPPEHGKTSVALNGKCKVAHVLTDMTGSGIRDASIAMDQITHFILLDLGMASAHSKKTNQFLTMYMNALSEEGFHGHATPAGQINMVKPVKKGFICCLTPKMARDGRQGWNKIGFTTRMLPFNYLFSDSLKNAIRHEINYPPNRVINLKEFQVPAAPIQVRLSTKMVREIDVLARVLSGSLGDDTGFRRLKQLRALACGHAIYRSWKKPEVGARDLEFLQRINKFISFQKGAEL